eukprot:9052161-Ditylum_brightwellii.AAC.1
MHTYQLEGLNWLIKLHDNGFNGILADILGDATQFDECFSLSGELGQHNAIQKLHTMLASTVQARTD